MFIGVSIEPTKSAVRDVISAHYSVYIIHMYYTYLCCPLDVILLSIALYPLTLTWPLDPWMNCQYMALNFPNVKTSHFRRYIHMNAWDIFLQNTYILFINNTNRFHKIFTLYLHYFHYFYFFVLWQIEYLFQLTSSGCYILCCSCSDRNISFHSSNKCVQLI